MFKKYTLSNGARLVLAPMHETKAITVLVLFKVGSRYETRQINGVSHFVEHLMFKGTKKRPTALSISKELDGIGAEYNAFTSKDHTGYYIKADSEHTNLVLDILADMVYNSKFDPKEIERERGVITEEINMYEDNPMMYIEDLFEQTMYGDVPLGWNIAGPKEVIKQVSRQDLFNYYQKYYQPQNMLVAVAGRFDHQMTGLIKKYFGNKSAVRSSYSFKKVAVSQKRPQTKIKFKETEQIQLALGFPAYSYFQEKIYPLYLLSVILGGNMSSRLFMSIREKKGLCYFIRSGVGVYEDTGNLVIQAGLDKKRLPEAIKEILKELARAKKEGVTKPELRKAKDFLKGKLILQLEASDNVASWLARQELLRKKILTPTEQIKRLEKVTLGDIAKVAGELFRTAKINLALIGPLKNDHDFRKLLKI